MNKTLWIYRITTGLFTIMLGMGAIMYFAKHDMVAEMFTSLGYPTYIIYPLAIAKVLGLVAILSKVSDRLADLAYAGFFYELILAASAHLAVGDGGFPAPLVALALAISSYVAGRKLAEQSRAVGA